MTSRVLTVLERPGNINTFTGGVFINEGSTRIIKSDVIPDVNSINFANVASANLNLLSHNETVNTLIGEVRLAGM